MMRQTAEHHSYIGRRAIVSCHGPSSACRSSGRRPGFTLVEVVVAAAILMILMIALMGTFSAGVSGFKNAQLMTFAQNLAEFQAEDLKSLPLSVLSGVCEGIASGVVEGIPPEYNIRSNYPYATPSASDPYYSAEALANDRKAWVYDSGSIPTDFIITGVDAIVPNADEYPISYRAGGPTEPVVPSPSALLLGTNILVESYPWEGHWFYVVRLMHQAYPLFYKRVQIECYDALDSSFHFVSSASAPGMDSGYLPARAMFSYTITVRYHQGASDRILYETRGVISSPYSS